MSSVYEIGRVCVKTMGRDAGKKCVIIEIIDKNFALIDGLIIKRRRANFKHLEPLEEKISLSKGAKHSEVEKAINDAKLQKLMKETIQIPL
jgi:large subunit ribosomal protein L14e